MMTDFGSHLRTLYIEKLKWLEPQFEPTQVYLRSTDYARTIETLQSIMSGLYPSVQNQPLQVNLRRDYNETLFATSQCRRFAALQKRYSQKFEAETETERQSISKELSHLLSSPSEASTPDTPPGASSSPSKSPFTELSNWRPPSLYGLYDTLYSGWAHGHDLSAAKVNLERVLHRLNEYAVKQWFSGYVDEPEGDVIRLGIGRLVGELNRQMVNSAIRQKNERRLCIYSAHDSTVGPLLCAFRVFDGNWPSFGANVTLELLRDMRLPIETEQDRYFAHYVRVKYNDRVLQIPETIRGGEPSNDPTLCRLDRFATMCDKVTPKKFSAECAQPLEGEAEFTEPPASADD